jgi:branched-subunit amino acid transport protein
MKRLSALFDPRELFYDLACLGCCILFYGLFLPDKSGAFGKMNPGMIVLIQFAAYLAIPWYLATLYNRAREDDGPEMLHWLFMGCFVITWLCCLFFLLVFSSMNLKTVLQMRYEGMIFMFYCIMGALAGILGGVMTLGGETSADMNNEVIRPARLVTGAAALWAALVYGLHLHRTHPWLALLLLLVGVALPIAGAVRLNAILTKRAGKRDRKPHPRLRAVSRVLVPAGVALIICGWQRLSIEGGFEWLGIRMERDSLLLLIASGVLPFRVLLAVSPPFRPLNLAIGIVVLYLNHASLADFIPA